MKALKAWMEYERQLRRMKKAFGSVLPKRNDRVQRLAWRLLIWHMEQGHTLESIAAMIDAPSGPLHPIVRQEVTHERARV